MYEFVEQRGYEAGWGGSPIRICPVREGRLRRWWMEGWRRGADQRILLGETDIED